VKWIGLADANDQLVRSDGIVKVGDTLTAVSYPAAAAADMTFTWTVVKYNAVTGQQYEETATGATYTIADNDRNITKLVGVVPDKEGDAWNNSDDPEAPTTPGRIITKGYGIEVGNVIADITLTYDNNEDSTKATKTYEGPEVGAWVHATTKTPDVTFIWSDDPNLRNADWVYDGSSVSDKGANLFIPDIALGKTLYVTATKAKYASTTAVTPEVVVSSRTIASAEIAFYTGFDREAGLPTFEKANKISVGDTVYMVMKDSEGNYVVPYGAEYQWALDGESIVDKDDETVGSLPELYVTEDYVLGTLSVTATPDGKYYVGDAVTANADNAVSWNEDAQNAIWGVLDEGLVFESDGVAGNVYSAFLGEGSNRITAEEWYNSGFEHSLYVEATAGDTLSVLDADISTKTVTEKVGGKDVDFVKVVLKTNRPVADSDIFEISAGLETFKYYATGATAAGFTLK
jgi:hypothetical protein